MNKFVVGMIMAVSLATVTGWGMEGYLSPSVVVASPDAKTLYVLESGVSRIAVVDVAAGRTLREIRLPLGPTGLAVSADGRTLFVTAGLAEGVVLGVEAASGKVTARFGAMYSPVAPVLSGDGKTLFVCVQFMNSVAVFDVATRREVARVPVTREPVAAALTPDGARLFVANLLPAGAASGEYMGAMVSVLDTAQRKVMATVALPNGAGSVQGVAVSADGQFVYLTHILSLYQLPTTQLERGWVNTAALSVLDAATGKYVNTVLLDEVDLGAANPWGVACSADGKTIVVTHAGTHEVSLIDRVGLHAKLARVARGERGNEMSDSYSDVPNDLSFLAGLRRRVGLKGLGPRGLAVVGERAFTAEYFSDTLGVVDWSDSNAVKVAEINLSPSGVVPQRMDTVRRGELLFHDARMCFQHWQSCSSCHPGNARTDGLNWDLLNDGIGNPKQTKSLLYAHQTPPAMLSGARESAESAVRAGVRFIQFAVRPEADAKAIDEYLKSLCPLPSPYASCSRPRSEAIRRGRRVFEKAKCAECHAGTYFTDQKEHNIGTASGMDAGYYDTPTLIEIWRTAPYLSDGRAATLRDVVKTCNDHDKHGKTSDLTQQEVDDLVAYLLTL
jgi:YVTN family beta-propeller protein